MSELDLDATHGSRTAGSDSEPDATSGPGPALMGATTLIGESSAIIEAVQEPADVPSAGAWCTAMPLLTSPAATPAV